MNTDRLLLAFNGLLVLFNALLAFFTYRLWHETARLAKATQASILIAQEAAEALPKIERAYVFVEVKLEQDIAHTPSGNTASPIMVYITNHGKTPAILTRLRGYALIQSTAPSELHTFPRSDDPMPEGIVIAAGATYPLQVTCHVSDSEWGQLGTLEKRLFCCGVVDYRDVLGRQKTTGYCWHLLDHLRHQRFVVSPNTPLNYTT